MEGLNLLANAACVAVANQPSSIIKSSSKNPKCEFPTCEHTYNRKTSAYTSLCKHHNTARIKKEIIRVDGTWRLRSSAPAISPISPLEFLPASPRLSPRRRFTNPSIASRPLSTSSINKKAKRVLEYISESGTPTEQSSILAAASKRLPSSPSCDSMIIENEKRGRKRKLEDGDDLNYIKEFLDKGLPLSSITILLNEYRSALHLSPVSLNTVRRYINRQSTIKRVRRGEKKSGSNDPSSPWLQARLHLCNQLINQFNDHSLFIDAIVFWDEKHKACVLGNPSTYQYLIKDSEGEWSKREPRTSMKYTPEARGCFGVAVWKINDQYIGHRCEPFNYTGRTLVSINDYQKAFNNELERVKKLKGQWMRKGNNTEELINIGYEGRYPLTWEAEVQLKINKKIYCITDLMDHIIIESNKIYANTPYKDTFRIYHDGLTLWWEKGINEERIDIHLIE